jgi:hypothetical protein
MSQRQQGQPMQQQPQQPYDANLQQQRQQQQRQSPDGGQQQQQGGDDPALQGEGNYAAARRHRESLERFIEDDRVDNAAAQAAPQDGDEAREMREAEAEGRSHAKTGAREA